MSLRPDISAWILVARICDKSASADVEKMSQRNLLSLCTDSDFLYTSPETMQGSAMPEAVTNELMYEVLKSIQAQVAIIREDVASLKVRTTSQDRILSRIEAGFADIHGDFAELGGRMDRLESRIERVENRLNLHDPGRH
jgi:hypothetical protein